MTVPPRPDPPPPGWDDPVPHWPKVVRDRYKHLPVEDFDAIQTVWLEVADGKARWS